MTKRMNPLRKRQMKTGVIPSIPREVHFGQRYGVNGSTKKV